MKECEQQALVNYMMESIAHIIGEYARATGKDAESVFFTTGKFMMDNCETLAKVVEK